MTNLSNELNSLLLVTAFTAVMWMPYILNMIMKRGLIDAVGYPEPGAPIAVGAKMKAAHANAIENLVVFATLVLIANAAGVSSDVTVMAANVYLWARIVHFASYTFAIPWVRTLAFVAGFACQIAFVIELL